MSVLRILLLSDMSREPERQLLKGLVNYANRNGGCAFFPVQSFLLTGSDKSISLVAEECGFTDIINVGRIFKRYTGLSPREYRTNKKNR